MHHVVALPSSEDDRLLLITAASLQLQLIPGNQYLSCRSGTGTLGEIIWFRLPRVVWVLSLLVNEGLD